MGTSKDYTPPTDHSWRPRNPELDVLPATGSVSTNVLKGMLRDYIAVHGGPSGMAGTGGGALATSQAGLIRRYRTCSPRLDSKRRSGLRFRPVPRGGRNGQ